MFGAGFIRFCFSFVFFVLEPSLTRFSHLHNLHVQLLHILQLRREQTPLGVAGEPANVVHRLATVYVSVEDAPEVGNLPGISMGEQRGVGVN